MSILALFFAVAALQPSNSQPAAKEPEKAPDTKPAVNPETKPDSKPDAKAAQPVRAASGKSLTIPADLSKLGTVYHTLVSDAKQITFSSVVKDPLGKEVKFDGHSSSVVGYAVGGPAESPAALKAGAWLLAVKSLDTGNKLRDKHIAAEDWLGAANNPDIIFVLKEVKDIKPHKESPSGKSYLGTLVGTMTVRGTSKELSIPDATLGFIKGSEGTAKIGKGDLLALRCKYKVKLSDFGVTNEQIGKGVADEIEIDQTLMLATVPPEEQGK